MSGSNRIKQYVNLYSIGVLPKIPGRYLSNSTALKHKKHTTQHHHSDFSLEGARNRLHVELKRREVCDRIERRSQRNRKAVKAVTEPIDYQGRLQTENIHIKPILLQLPLQQNTPKLTTINRGHSLELNSPYQARRVQKHSERQSNRTEKLKLGRMNGSDEERDEANCSINQWRQSVRGETQNIMELLGREQEGLYEGQVLGVRKRVRWPRKFKR